MFSNVILFLRLSESLLLLFLLLGTFLWKGACCLSELTECPRHPAEQKSVTLSNIPEKCKDLT